MYDGEEVSDRHIVPPSTRDRIESLDALRGLAVLAILLSNIVAFASPEMTALMTGQSLIRDAADGWIASLHTALVSGKPRAMLCLLFGVGLYLQFAKRRGDPLAWPGGYLKRSLWLAALGLAHYIAIWDGDILFLYGISAFVACFLVRMADRTLLTIALAGTAIMTVVCGFVGGLWPMIAEKFAQQDAVDIGDEVAVFASGAYGDQVLYRLQQLGELLSSAPFVLLEFVPLFLVGVILSRTGALARPSAHPRIRNACLAWGFGLGLPVNLIALIGMADGPPAGIRLFLEGPASSVLAVGYLMLAACAFEGARSGLLKRLLSPVGRFALTVYLSQSVLCTVFFYSWGLGYYDQLGRPQLLLVVLGVWAVNLMFAHLWARRFSLGPVEWLWRSLTESRRLPILKGRELIEAPPPAPAPAGSPPPWSF